MNEKSADCRKQMLNGYSWHSKDELSLFSSLSLSVDNTIRKNMLIYKGRKQHKNWEESLCSLDMCQVM